MVDVAAHNVEPSRRTHEQHVLCSAPFAEQLSPDLRAKLVELGEVPIRGRRMTLGLLGC